uniref:NADP-dependent oxidoreductase domain-containing protein n=1 Tax=Ananas comosus var. bracteatus TaxID=296719 RepID=A0A6V7Q2M2_ANACO|nr:unnamed protein product [Ananas comosus var. bracteatus]
METRIPEVCLSSGSSSKAMPRIGMGTAAYPFVSSEATQSAISHAIKLGYRHFDTAALYQSEEPLGEAVSKAVRSGSSVRGTSSSSPPSCGAATRVATASCRR